MAQLRKLIQVVLPLAQITPYLVLQQIQWIQQRNYAAYLSHKKRSESLSYSDHFS